jgi:hypothetical protein
MDRNQFFMGFRASWSGFRPGHIMVEVMSIVVNDMGERKKS